MIEAGTSKPAPFDIVVVHVFSRFFRDHFELEFHVRKLAKNGIGFVSITQEMGDDAMQVMMRQIMAPFDEYQSKESAKHVLRTMNENARQAFRNQAITPDMVEEFAQTARQRMRLENSGYRRDHLRAFAQRVEVADKEAYHRIEI